MFYDLTFIIMIVAFLFLLVCALTPVIIYIKRRPWRIRNKKIVFSLVGAFLVFPALIPAGTVVGILIPNIVYIILALFVGSVSEMLGWYSRIFTFCAVSYIITLSVLGLMSQVIFFERKQD